MLLATKALRMLLVGFARMQMPIDRRLLDPFAGDQRNNGSYEARNRIVIITKLDLNAGIGLPQRLGKLSRQRIGIVVPPRAAFATQRGSP